MNEVKKQTDRTAPSLCERNWRVWMTRPTWRKSLVWAVHTQFGKWFFLLPLTCRSKWLWPWWGGPVTLRQIGTSCLWTMLDRKAPSQSGLLMMLRNAIVAVIILRLGLWPSESGTNEIVINTLPKERCQIRQFKLDIKVQNCRNIVIWNWSQFGYVVMMLILILYKLISTNCILCMCYITCTHCKKCNVL